MRRHIDKMHTYMDALMHIYMHGYNIFIDTHKHTHINTLQYKHICIHTYIAIHTCMQKYTHTYVYT